MKSAVYIMTDSISKSSYDNLELEYLKQLGITIHICLYCKKEEYSTFNATNNPEYLGSDFDIIHSYNKFEKYIKRFSNDSVFIFNVWLSPSIWYTLAKHKCNYIVIGPRTGHPIAHDLSNDSWSIPRYLPQKSIIHRIVELIPHPYLFIQLSLSKLLNLKRDKLNKLSISDIANKYPPKYVLVDTQYDKDYFLPEFLKNKNLVYVPSVDYNKYLHQIINSPKESAEFILYVHSGILFNMRGFADRDRLLSVFSNNDIRKKYMQNLEDLFDKMENYFNLPIIIAAHPNVNFEGYTFGNRKIIYGNTCELVQKCFMYIGPASTAASFAVLFNKRLLIIYCNAEKESDDLRFHEYYEPLLQELQIPGGNLDDHNFMENPWNYSPFISEHVRNSYIDKYLCEPTSDHQKTYGEYLRDLIEYI